MGLMGFEWPTFLADAATHAGHPRAASQGYRVQVRRGILATEKWCKTLGDVSLLTCTGYFAACASS